MVNAVSNIAVPVNEPVLSYASGSSERASIRAELASFAVVDIPLTIAGEDVRTSTVEAVNQPHAHAKRVGNLFVGNATHINAAVSAALSSKHDWARMAFDDRAAIFLKAADLLAGRYRAHHNAAAMLGQGKTVHQAEIDAACELIDFWRFNVHFARQLLEEQPLSSPGVWNRTDFRPLDGFVAAITPFNFPGM
ncbi:MAG: aldehyde dehydrogenase family protein, partial [Clostridia bacterium]|nr:aldehyde dehydrogenase family protein [Deltaproteobacteria bacterium]